MLSAAEGVAEWLQAADLCVQATKEEAFCLIAAEALACGTPVVATRVGGLPEVVRDGYDGLLVPGQDPGAFAEAIATLLADQSRRESMGNAAIAWAASRFGLDRMIDDYLEWFESVLQTFDARRPEQSRPRLHQRPLFDSRRENPISSGVLVPR